MRELLAKKYKININNDFKLLEAIGRDCAGAISFYQKSEPELEENFIKIKGRILSDNELKKLIEELPYKPYMGNRISLAGAQEKTAVCVIDGKIAMPEDNIPTTHIIKTALPKYAKSIQNEYICMKLAQKIGIDVPNVEIRNVDGLEFLLVERFDRGIDEYCDGNVDHSDSYTKDCDSCTNHMQTRCVRMKRILQEDFAQSLGVQSRDKYDVTFKDCLWVLNQTTTPARIKLEFVKRVVFNYLIGNTDAHSKNFSLSFYAPNDIDLTPAYDLLCTSVYDCDQRIAMKIGKSKFYKDVTEKDWELFAQDIDISPKIVKSELEHQRKLIIPALEDILKYYNCEIGNKILEYVQSNL
jgi:serine/threonine-protein kinase HipA